MNQEDHSRLEGFRQFRREVRGSKEYLLVGIDVAKDRHHAFFGTAPGKTVFRRLVFDNNREGFQKLLAQAVRLVPGGLDCFGEESGFYRILPGEAAGSRKGAGDQDQDAGEAGGQDVDHCLDVDEEKGAL